MQNNYLMGLSRTGMAACMAAAIAALPLMAAAADLDMLGSLTKGVWNMRIRDDGTEQRICVRTGREFIQLRHRQPGCSQVVVRDNPNEVVIQYTCRGNGYGRTSIRREGNGLVQIESQGIADGTPFSISGEARHTGKC
ncbi:hypothetical protein [Altererythrobacter sp. Root672]|uniref:hypothetical protein n=1 Tax=Altererythrobacter sp. Root672 TaxID=1736584 RepID=UPI000B2375A2|nr:hypothetical protein [Altererythrobacter sp. Root672]